MTSSTSSSGRALTLAALVAAAAACGHRPRGDLDRPLRLLVLPPHDLSASGAPLGEIRSRAELALARIGAEIVTGAVVDGFLAARRTRHTGGIDGAVASAARETLGVDAVLVTTVVEWRETAPPAVQVTMRLVSAEPDPRLLWIHGAARSGQDHVGLLGLGARARAGELLPEVLGELRDSLRRNVNGPTRRSVACAVQARFEPQAAFRFPGLDLSRTRRVAVLPFETRTGRRGAGEALSLEVSRGLATVPVMRLVEPGVLRNMLLGSRYVMVDGVSLELGDMLMSNAEVDLVVTGVVDAFEESIPSISFSVVVFDTRLRRVVWRASTHHRGDDGVVLFDAGRVWSAGALACRMVAPLVRDIARPPPRARSLASAVVNATLAPR
jgi:hypothetical protein